MRIVNGNEGIIAREYFNSEEIQEDIDEQNLTVNEAREIYYRCLSREETKKINSLAKVSMSLEVDSSTKENLQIIKQKEQLRLKLEIFRVESLFLIEATILGCIRFDHVQKRYLENTIEAIEKVKADINKESREYLLIFSSDDIHEPAQVYYNLLKDCARRGISDLLDLSRVLYRKSHGSPLEFTSEKMEELCEVWLSFIKEYKYFNERFLPLYKQNEKYMLMLFKGKSACQKDILQIDISVKEYIIVREEETRNKFLKDLVTQAYLMATIRKKMKAKYSFLHSYYENRLKRYSEVQQFLIDNTGEDGKYSPRAYDIRMAFISFSVIFENLKSEYRTHLKKNCIHFGVDGCTYLDLTYRLLMTLEVLHSTYLQLAILSMNPVQSRECNLSGPNTFIYVDGKKKSVPYRVARDICRKKLDDLRDEIFQIQSVDW